MVAWLLATRIAWLAGRVKVRREYCTGRVESQVWFRVLGKLSAVIVSSRVDSLVESEVDKYGSVSGSQVRVRLGKLT